MRDVGRILIGLAIAAFSLISFFASQEYNPITGENQFVSLTPRQEIALGLQSAPDLIQQYGGVFQDQRAQILVDDIGFDLVQNSVASDTPWQFEFTVLSDPQTVNAFALPGGQVFITTALLGRMDREDQVAAVLAHEIVHVLARHGAQRLAQSELTNGLIGAVAVASEDAGAVQTAAVVGQLVNLQYGRDDEIQSDTLGVCLMIDAGYDPTGMIEVQQILAQASQGGRPPEFLSTHPSPDNRIQRIQQAIADAPAGCP
ncbi:MAG: M48 family metalloprotease [Chloroflexota bacterium]